MCGERKDLLMIPNTQADDGFRLAKSISRLKPYWAGILPAKEMKIIRK